jgi:hypothetical protein
MQQLGCLPRLVAPAAVFGFDVFKPKLLLQDLRHLHSSKLIAERSQVE